VPVIYSMLAVYNTALQAKYARTKDPRYLVPMAEERQLVWRDLLGFRRNKGLAGHAEMEGKTLFLKFNTGPSGHGSPPSAGEAIALKRAGADGVKVFAIEGEGGLTAGASHETKNSAYGLGLDNLHYLIDWNDWGIDEVPTSRIVHGDPRGWFEPYGFNVNGTEQGSDLAPSRSARVNPREPIGTAYADRDPPLGASAKRPSSRGCHRRAPPRDGPGPGRDAVDQSFPGR